jgi:hypothetical protein
MPRREASRLWCSSHPPQARAVGDHLRKRNEIGLDADRPAASGSYRRRCYRRVLHLGLAGSEEQPSGSQGVAAVSRVPANGVAIGSQSGGPTTSSDPVKGR